MPARSWARVKFPCEGLLNTCVPGEFELPYLSGLFTSIRKVSVFGLYCPHSLVATGPSPDAPFCQAIHPGCCNLAVMNWFNSWPAAPEAPPDPYRSPLPLPCMLVYFRPSVLASDAQPIASAMNWCCSTVGPTPLGLAPVSPHARVTIAELGPSATL